MGQIIWWTLCYAYRNYGCVMNNSEEHSRLNLLDNLTTNNSANWQSYKSHIKSTSACSGSVRYSNKYSQAESLYHCQILDGFIFILKDCIVSF